MTESSGPNLATPPSPLHARRWLILVAVMLAFLPVVGSMTLPTGIPADMAGSAVRSIGDTIVVAGKLPEDLATALVASGKQAFSEAHGVLLTVAGGLIAVLSAVVFVTLKDAKAGH